MTADPYLASGGSGEPSSWNRFAYVEGDPVNYLDPLGLDKCGANPHCVEVFAPFQGVSPEEIGLGGRLRTDDGILYPATPREKAEERNRIREENQRSICDQLPDAGILGGQLSMGLIAGGSLTAEVVFNYRTGELTGFFSVGVNALPQAVGQVQGSTGFVWGIGSDNSSFTKLGTTIGTSVGPIGAQLSLPSGGMSNPMPTGLEQIALQMTLSVGLRSVIPWSPSFGASNTVGSISFGRIPASVSSSLLPSPHAQLFSLQQDCMRTR